MKPLTSGFFWMIQTWKWTFHFIHCKKASRISLNLYTLYCFKISRNTDWSSALVLFWAFFKFKRSKSTHVYHFSLLTPTNSSRWTEREIISHFNSEPWSNIMLFCLAELQTRGCEVCRCSQRQCQSFLKHHQPANKSLNCTLILSLCLSVSVLLLP